MKKQTASLIFISATYFLAGCSHNTNSQNSLVESAQQSPDTDMSINRSINSANNVTSNVTNKATNSATNNPEKQQKTSNHGLTQDFDTLTVSTAKKTTDETSENTDWQWNLPKYFPIPNVPKDNPMTLAKVELGRHLFYDPRLSVNGSTSCASCHLQELAFTDGKARSIGATGEMHDRSSLGLANVAYMPTLNWANPAITKLEDQLLVPMFGEMPVEMGLTDASFVKVQSKLAKDSKYQRLFAEAFAKEFKPDSNQGKDFTKAKDYSLVEISKAIASFERSLISADSKFDRYMQGKAKLTESEMRGKTLFFGEKAECHHCHGSFNFNDQVVHSKSRTVPIRFHNTGMYNLDAEGSYIENNEGLFDVTANVEDKGKFKAPSLRNVAVTAPYNHDGSTKTLEDVLANYAIGGRIIHSQSSTATGKEKSDISATIDTSNPNTPSDTGNIDNSGNSNNSKNTSDNTSRLNDGRFNPNKSDLIVRIDLNDQEQADIIAFLKTLTDESLLTNPAYSDPWAVEKETNDEK